MGNSKRRPLVRSLVAVAALATSMLVAGPTPAQAATCEGHFQPGATVTVGGTPVRIPSIDVQVCYETATTSLVPLPVVVIDPQGGCYTSCFALILRSNPIYDESTVSVRVRLDGTGIDRSVSVPVPSSNFCIVGAGFPAPPVSGCFVSYDPDF